jgi:voltage-gated potassium channel
MYYIEGEGQPDKFGSVPPAAYWALTTVGYGDATPLTPLGKLWSMLTMLTGLCACWRCRSPSSRAALPRR